MIDKGHEVILWTSRVDAELAAAVEWCNSYGLYFCAVNDNAPSNKAKYLAKYPNGTRKVYADIYVDDHNLEYVMWDSRYVNKDEMLVYCLTKGVERWKIEEN